MNEELVEDSTTTKHINHSISVLAVPKPESTQKTRAKVCDRLVSSNPQSPEINVGLGEKKNTFNQFASIQQHPIPLNQTAVLFPVESIDDQPELIHSSIEELNQFSS